MVRLLVKNGPEWQVEHPISGLSKRSRRLPVEQLVTRIRLRLNGERHTPPNGTPVEGVDQGDTARVTRLNREHPLDENNRHRRLRTGTLVPFGEPVIFTAIETEAV